MPPAVRIEPVTTRRQRRAFLLFPWRIYEDEPNWVPPIVGERSARLDPHQNPLFRQGEAAPFVAVRDNRVVGTIALAVDRRANQVRGEQIAVFGFFECVNDYAVAQALLDQAVAWARARDLETLRGPQSFSANDEPGLLIEGRKTPPAILQGWTPPYYVDLIERYGFRKYVDSLAYRIYRDDLPGENGDKALPAKLVRVAEYARQRHSYTIRHVDPDNWDTEMEIARHIYNRSLATLPEFTPMGEREWREQAEKLRPLIDPDLAVFSQVDGREVGFGLGLPDVNQALWHCNGLRYPWNYLQLWWYSRHITGLSFKIMALLPEYWGRGLDALIYLEIAQAWLRKGYRWMDLSLTSEDNPMTNKLATRAGARLNKRYRTYKLDLRTQA
jgi:GNAT superfamily N-acetyltransferase